LTRLATLRPLWVLMATVFIDMVGFTMVLPLLPFYATRLGASPTVIGFLVATYACAQLATAPLWGRLSDRYGRRPLIIAGLAISGVAYLLFGLANALWVLFACRLVQGMGGGITGVVQAYVADFVPPVDRTRALGWISAATSAGVMVGPAMGSLATHVAFSAPGFMAAGLCAANVVFAHRWLAEPPAGTRTQAPRGAVRAMIAHVVRHPTAPVSVPVWIYAIGMMAFMAMNAVLALYLRDTFGVTEKTIGYFYVYVGAISVIMRALLLGPATHRFGEGGVVWLGTLSLVVGLAALPLSGSLPLLALSVIFIPIGTALLFPATTSLVSTRAPKERTGQALGVQQAFGGVARLVGPMWAGALFEIGPGVPFWAGACIMAAISVPAFALRRGTSVERALL
jgi:multidrug resistance protein